MLFTVTGIRKFFGRPRQLATLNGHKSPVVTIDISPKGDLLARFSGAAGVLHRLHSLLQLNSRPLCLKGRRRWHLGRYEVLLETAIPQKMSLSPTMRL